MGFDIVIILGMSCLGYLIKFFLPKYLEQKAKNFATKEDFNQILSQLKESTEVIEKIKNEFYLTKVTYDKYIEYLMDFYSNVYKYYRSCQHAASFTHKEFSDGAIISTKDEWEEKLDEVVNESKRLEGYIRILLPKNIKDINSDLIDSFNEFRDIMKKEVNGRDKQKKLKNCFNERIEVNKKNLEDALQKLLKIDALVQLD